MNRRNFFTWIAAAIGWLRTKQQPEVATFTQHWYGDNGSYGGFTVPAEMAPQIEKLVQYGEPVRLEFHIEGQPTIEQVCKLRGINPLTTEERAADQKRMAMIRRLLARKRVNATRT